MGILINQTEEQAEDKTVLVMKQQPMMFAGPGDIGYFVVWTIFMFYLCSDMITAGVLFCLDPSWSE